MSRANSNASTRPPRGRNPNHLRLGKTKGNGSYGAQKERELIEMLESEGWLAIRSAGSHGPADIFAAHRLHVPMLIQVKAGDSGSVFQRFPPIERLALSVMAEQCGVNAYLARWHRGAWDLIPECEWPAPPRTGPEYIEDEDGNWLWTGSVDRAGYGKLHRDGQTLAHRWYWIQRFGPVPADRPILDHLCRVHRCVNPEHLEPVTQIENRLRGLLTRLTAADVREIRASSESSSALAERFQITRGHAWRVRTRRVRLDVR
jgi:Holliday junction resolvase